MSLSQQHEGGHYQDEAGAEEEYGEEFPQLPDPPTPRTIEACRAIGVEPEHLKLVSEEEYQAMVAAANQPNDHPEGLATYEEYVGQVIQAANAVLASREEMIRNGTNSQNTQVRSSFDHNTAHSQMRPKSEVRRRNNASKSGPQLKKSKDTIETTKRPKTALQNAAKRRSTKSVGKTGVQGSQIYQPDHSQLAKSRDLELEQQVYQNRLAVEEAVEHKKLRLVNKIFTGNWKTQELKARKHEERVLANQIKMTREKEREMRKFAIGVQKENRNYVQKSQLEEKEKIALMKAMENMSEKQRKAMGRRLYWEQKRANDVANTKDLQEFKRGVLQANICLENQRCEHWKKQKEEEAESRRIISSALRQKRQLLEEQIKRTRERQADLQLSELLQMESLHSVMNRVPLLSKPVRNSEATSQTDLRRSRVMTGVPVPPPALDQITSANQRSKKSNLKQANSAVPKSNNKRRAQSAHRAP